MRITADGKLKVCLFGEDGFSFKEAFKGNKLLLLLLLPTTHSYHLLYFLTETMEEDKILESIHQTILRKKFALGGHTDALHIAASGKNRPMILIGG